MTQNEQFPSSLSKETIPLDKLNSLNVYIVAQMTEFKNQHLVLLNCQDSL